MRRPMSNLPHLAPLFTAFAFACVGGKDTDLETAFCELLANGPEVDVTADAEGEGEGPEIALADQKVEIALVEGDDGLFSGVARFTPDEPGAFALGLGDNVPIAVLDGQGEPLPWVAEVVGASCDALAVRYTVELEMETYLVVFGPTDLDEVDFVSEESDDDL